MDFIIKPLTYKAQTDKDPLWCLDIKNTELCYCSSFILPRNNLQKASKAPFTNKTKNKATTYLYFRGKHCTWQINVTGYTADSDFYSQTITIKIQSIIINKPFSII